MEKHTKSCCEKVLQLTTYYYVRKDKEYNDNIIYSKRNDKCVEGWKSNFQPFFQGHSQLENCKYVKNNGFHKPRILRVQMYDL